MHRELEREIEKKTPGMKLWVQVLAIGGILYFVGLLILYATQNPVLFPTIALLGSFLVPAAFVAFFYENRELSRLPLMIVVLAFFYGGALGVFAASILESLFLAGLTFFTAFEVGLIEEFSKILPLFILAKGRKHQSQTNGMILGAALGMGFAALESSGYAFASFIESRGNLTFTVGVILLRAVLAPVGHGAWTAILAGVLFRESFPYQFRLNASIVLTFLGVSLLHGLWDGVPILLGGLLGSVISVFLGELLVSGVSLGWLYWLWEDAKSRQVTDTQED